MSLNSHGNSLEQSSTSQNPHLSNETAEVLNYRPLTIAHNYSIINRECLSFSEYPGQGFFEQSFVPRSTDKNSLEFLKEYNRYISDPVNNPHSPINNSNDIVDREDLTPQAIEAISKKLNIQFEKLPVYPFFQKLENGTYRPTHDLICQMFCVTKNTNFPIWLAGGHLGNADNSKAQFDYYTKFLMQGMDDLRIEPNRPTVVRILQEVVKEIKASSFNRLLEVELDIQQLNKIFKAAGVEPFSLYESFLRDKLHMFNNITTGDKIGFKLNSTTILFLYMCCPSDNFAR